ncbi:hypothetical protein ACH5RR_031876 [Cinchona calisaya]|uniref:Uncharacterized protein n=1 Tax=Cinchona calisaya TaxID=153742 RepID=A0ABD2YJ78_9GENT
MDSSIEMCDLIAEKPKQFPDKLVWICGRCPLADSLLTGSARVLVSSLNDQITTINDINSSWPFIKLFRPLLPLFPGCNRLEMTRLCPSLTNILLTCIGFRSQPLICS